MMRTHLRLDDADESCEVVLERTDEADPGGWIADLDGRRVPFNLDELAAGSGVLRRGERVCRFHAVRTQNHVLVWVMGRTYRFEIVDPQARRQSGPAGGLRDITAPMPGRVLQIQVEPGATFEAHAPLVILESMKMELTLSAPAAGRARQINCAVGDMVDMGATLVSVDEI
jgi:biotin carboxyl carrier protein